VSGLGVARHAQVLWLTIDRPESRNALNKELLAHLTKELEAASDDPELRAIVITGAGERAFSAGGDVRTTDKESAFAVDHAQVDNPLASFFEAVERCNLPIVARVNGAAMGGGLGLVACADIAVATDDAVFGTPEVRIGVFPMIIATYLARLVPRRRLAQMALLGETFGAQIALELGLVNFVTPRDELDAKVDEVLSAICERSPTAIRLGKRALHAVQDMSFQQALDYMVLMIGRVSQTQDAKEGFAAFAEKRKPVWTGR